MEPNAKLLFLGNIIGTPRSWMESVEILPPLAEDAILFLDNGTVSDLIQTYTIPDHSAANKDAFTHNQEITAIRNTLDGKGPRTDRLRPIYMELDEELPQVDMTEAYQNLYDLSRMLM